MSSAHKGVKQDAAFLWMAEPCQVRDGKDESRLEIIMQIPLLAWGGEWH